MSNISKIYDLKRDLMDVIEACGQNFFSEADLPGGFKIANFLSSWEVILKSGIGVIFKAERDGKVIGLLGSLLSYDLNTGEVIATEAFWFILKQYRSGFAGIRLFEAFEEWGMSVGAVRFNMGRIIGLHDEKMGNFFESKGYRPVETHYWKQVKHD
jgi:hypothetical protein